MLFLHWAASRTESIDKLWAKEREALTALISWGVTLYNFIVSSEIFLYASKIVDFRKYAKAFFEAGLEGFLGAKKRFFTSSCLKFLVLAKYALRALTGHNFASSSGPTNCASPLTKKFLGRLLTLKSLN